MCWCWCSCCLQPTPRYHHTFAAINDTIGLYVAGFDDRISYLSDVWSFNANTSEWAKVGGLSNGRAYFTAVCLLYRAGWKYRRPIVNPHIHHYRASYSYCALSKWGAQQRKDTYACWVVVALSCLFVALLKYGHIVFFSVLWLVAILLLQWLL